MKTPFVLGLVLLAAACGGGSNASANAPRDTLTERQRDSALARSSVPGHNAVGAAMRAADTTSARVRADTTQ
ncbi:MAG TPA: hypothetical protein VNX15_01940 [Gemmatimonadales bacterium]|jgi:hypothetical protein|nr:hypothetical protein [Gemmatimonadales bacterium]